MFFLAIGYIWYYKIKKREKIIISCTQQLFGVSLSSFCRGSVCIASLGVVDGFGCASVVIKVVNPLLYQHQWDICLL